MRFNFPGLLSSRQQTEVQDDLHHGQGVEAGSHIIDHDAHAFGQSCEQTDRRRLDDIEPSKKYKGQQQRLPRYRSRNQSNELPGNFVNYHKLRILQTTGPRDTGSGGNSDEHGDGSQ